MRTATHIGGWILVATLGIVAFLNPMAAFFAVLGIGATALSRSQESRVPLTKRRSLNQLWNLFGGYALGSVVLCGATMLVMALVFHKLTLAPLVFFTVLACWLPTVGWFLRRKKR